MVKLESRQQGTCFIFSAYIDGEEVATMTAEFHGDNVMIHNTVFRWGPQVLRALRLLFADARTTLREAGAKLLIASAVNEPHKRRHYWKLIGFECFGTCEEQPGRIAHFAVMEA
jgi:hypothetical protein